MQTAEAAPTLWTYGELLRRHRTGDTNVRVIACCNDLNNDISAALGSAAKCTYISQLISFLHCQNNANMQAVRISLFGNSVLIWGSKDLFELVAVAV
jgi:hypothetical protein